MNGIRNTYLYVCGSQRLLDIRRIYTSAGLKRLSPFHSGCFGLASPELAKGEIAYRFHSEKLIRSPAN